MPLTPLLLPLLAYLLGSLSFARIVTRLVSPATPVTEFEAPMQRSGDTFKFQAYGASTVSSKLGPKVGMLVALLDILKAFLPVLAGRLLYPDQPWVMLLAGLAAMAGHIWPVYYRFRGGSGFTPLMGSLLVIDPLAVIVLPVLGIVIGMVVLRSLVFAFLGWLVLLIPWLWWRTAGDAWYIAFAVAANLVYLAGMLPELRQMRRYRKEGRLIEYGESTIQATPMGRGMLKLAKKFNVPLR